MRTLTTLAATALLVCTAATPADAQGRVRRPTQPRARLGIHTPRASGFRARVAVPMGRAQRVQPRAGMQAGAGLFAPGTLIRQREFLELTDEQVARFEQLDEQVREAREQAAAQTREHREALAEALQADRPDVAAVRQHAQALHVAQQAAQLAYLTAIAEGKGLLTDEQRARLEGWVAGARRGAARRAFPMGRGWRPFE